MKIYSREEMRDAFQQLSKPGRPIARIAAAKGECVFQSYRKSNTSHDNTKKSVSNRLPLEIRARNALRVMSRMAGREV